MIGRRFTRLVVERAAAPAERGRKRWWCRCDCGTTVEARETSLKNGHTLSCGCLGHERRMAGAIKSNTTHGHNRRATGPSRTYKSWQGMIQRCANPKATSFPRYGARGVSVCRRWLKFENFLEDMGERQAGLSLDRFPNRAGNYEPGNCRWATPKEQNVNRRPRKIAPVDATAMAKLYASGKSQREIGKAFGIDQSTVSYWLKRAS